MNVAHICLEFDCAGVAWNLSQAINLYSEHESRHACYRFTHVATQTDIQIRNMTQVKQLAVWADVLHFHQWIWLHRPGGRLACNFDTFDDYGDGMHPFRSVLADANKRTVFHFHGGKHQLRPGPWIEECERVGAKILKCDPLAPIAGATWMPNVCSIPDNLRAVPLSDMGPARVAIMGGLHDKRRNNGFICDALTEAVIEHDLFHERPKAQALEQRQAFHVAVDNLTQGFAGMWTWESLALGQVVFCRLDELTKLAYADTFGAMPPIVHVPNVDVMVSQINALRDNPETCRDIADSGRAWTKQFNRPEHIAAKYMEMYERLF